MCSRAAGSRAYPASRWTPWTPSSAGASVSGRLRSPTAASTPAGSAARRGGGRGGGGEGQRGAAGVVADEGAQGLAGRGERVDDLRADVSGRSGDKDHARSIIGPARA